jgi:hypothetical protein
VMAGGNGRFTHQLGDSVINVYHGMPNIQPEM